MTDALAVEAAVAAIGMRHRRLDILVSNAGGTVRKPLLDQTEADWQSVLDAHLTAGWRLARAVAADLAPHGITVNVLAPGYVPTQGNLSLRESDPGFMAGIASRTPVGRWGRPDEIGAAALYLASPAAGFTTGSVLTVDGGLTAVI